MIFLMTKFSDLMFQKKDDSENILEGRDISVCSRVRPLLPYEVAAGYFETIIANQPKIHAFEPRFNFKKAARPVTTTTNVTTSMKNTILFQLKLILFIFRYTSALEIRFQ